MLHDEVARAISLEENSPEYQFVLKKFMQNSPFKECRGASSTTTTFALFGAPQ
jgi:hypothetical protein